MSTIELKDSFNRKIDYIRVSLTKNCNLRCKYCMPECGVYKESLLKIKDYEKVLLALSEVGIKKIKITGGEPLVRKDTMDLVKSLKESKKFTKITLTTNGLLIDKYIDEIINYMDGVNISIDSLNDSMYKYITGGELQNLKENIRLLLKRGYKNIKLNTVLIRGFNDKEILNLITFAEDNNLILRFIELMPMGKGKAYNKFSREEIDCVVSKVYKNKKRYNGKLGNGPAEYFTYDNLKIKIGFIDALGHSFCKNCNRIRLDSDGKIVFCLCYDTGFSTLDYIDGSITKDEFLKRVTQEILLKPMENIFNKKSESSYSMNELGG
ncbi:MAG: GTP 3',8-cyclase MoaA [Treponema phagedenis]|uniref:GTP 3',8-cyclase MoaA n=1 Tax=Treponema phagedenis TaxID=162 RepID=UPI0006827532|nr:GTP 3',8-cyclase MoaA [Treponema phagedenis]TYT78282.1 GTP 3',8-cyclase MoaA [Treponema phagedenis]